MENRSNQGDDMVRACDQENPGLTRGNVVWK